MNLEKLHKLKRYKLKDLNLAFFIGRNSSQFPQWFTVYTVYTVALMLPACG